MGYKICPYCKARLDPGERCDCRDAASPPQKENAGTGEGSIHNDHNKKEEQHYE